MPRFEQIEDPSGEPGLEALCHESMSHGEIKAAAMIASFANFIHTRTGAAGVLMDRKEEPA